MRLGLSKIGLSVALGLCQIALGVDAKQPESAAIHVSGSDTVAFVLRKVSESYMQFHPEVSIFVSAGGTWRGYKSVLDGSADIGMISAPLPDDLRDELTRRGEEFLFFPLAIDAVVPIVNPQNPIQQITLPVLRDIFSGAVTQWRDISIMSGTIKVLSREVHSGSFELWRDSVITSARALVNTAVQLKAQDLVREVATDEKAIGYTTMVNLKDSVKALSVNGIAPTKESIAQGTYPLWRRIGMVVPQKSSARVKAFVEYALSKDYGLKFANEAHWIIPLNVGIPEILVTD